MSDCDHRQAPGPGLQGDLLDRALVRAEGRCRTRGERLTAPRRRVLELLLSADGPVKAYELMGRFGGEAGPAKPPTVYRALDFLERQGLAHRLATLNAYVACRGDGEGHAAAFLICDCCGAAIEVEALALDGVAEAARANRFTIDSVVLEARGVCARCV